MIFEIDGLDIVPYIKEEDIDWQWNGLDGPDAGRTMDGNMHRGLVAIKSRCDIGMFWMPKETALQIHKKIMPEYVTIRTDTIPWEEDVVTKEMYSNNVSQKCLTEYSDGTKLYGDLEFPLIER